MNKNALKIVAMVSMLIDHVGLILFPRVAFLRYLGRLAMSIFAFSIGDGCLRTRNKLFYFLRIFILGALCQLAYIVEELITSGGIGSRSSALYMNILITFSLSVCLCSAYLRFADSVKNKESERVQLAKGGVFAVALVAIFLLFRLFNELSRRNIASITIDYGFMGVCLPLFAVITGKDSLPKQKAVFAFGVVLFAAFALSNKTWQLFALAAIPVIFAYNGKKGKLNMKYAFYIFYPAHIAVIYLIDMII